MEQWRQIEDFYFYSVSDHGRVLALEKEKLVPTRNNLQGFEMVTINDDNFHQKTRSVAILVAKAFLPPPRNSAYNSIIHLNGDRSDCRVMNLMWRPRWFALRYHQMFDREPIRVSVYIPKLNKVYFSLREACTTHGLIEMDTYIAMINNEPCFHYGWIFQRFEQ